MKDLTRNLVVMTLLCLFVFSAFSGALIPIADAMKDMDTPVAAIENDTYRSYYDSGNFYDSFRSDIESMGGYVYDSASEEKSKKKTTALDYEFQPIKQVITVKTTATGSKENGNYVESKPLANAIVRINGVPRFTDRNGQVRATLDREYVELFVEKNDYGPYIEIMEVTGEDKTVYLKKASDNIDIYGVMLTDIEYDPVNLINSEYTIFPEALGDYIANMKFLVNVKADRYMLLMDSEVIYSSNENTLYNIDFTDDMEGKKFYAQVEYQDILSEPVLLNLSISIPEFYKEEDIEEYSARDMDFLNPFNGEDSAGMFDELNIDLKKIPQLKKCLKNVNLNLVVNMREGTVSIHLGYELKDVIEDPSVKEVKEKISNLKKREESANNQKKKCQEEVNKSKEEIATCKNKVNENKLKIQQQEDFMRDLDRQMAQVDKNNKEEIARINERKDIAANDIRDYQKDVDKNAEKIAKEMSAVAGYYDQIDNINAQQKKEFDYIKGEIDNANIIVNSLKNDVEETEKKISEINDKVNKGNLDISNLDSLINNIGKDIRTLEDSLSQNNKSIKFSVEFFGNIIYNFKENKIVRFSVTLGAKLEFIYDGTFMAGYVPMFYVVKIDVDLSAKIDIYEKEKKFIEYRKFYEYILFKLGLGIEVELGVGVNDLLSVSAFAGASYSIMGYIGLEEFRNHINECAGSRLELQIGIRLKALYIFTYELSTKKIFNKEHLPIEKIKELYGDNHAKSLSTAQFTNNLLAENIYDGSKPQIEKVGDDYVASWIDMEIRNGEPRSVLKYSVYSNGNWGVPKEVYGSGSDFYHDTYFDGKDLHVTWQNIKEGTDITSLEDMCKNSEIYYAKYDSELSQFVGVRQVSDNTTLDMGPKFALQESADQPLTIVWQKNSAEDLIGLNGRNSIVYSTFDLGNWSVPNMLYESDNYFSFVNSAYVDSKLTSAFVEDMDNDLTTDDRKIIVCAEGVQCKIVGSDFEIVNNPQFFKIDGKTRLTFHADGNVRFTDDYVNVNKFDIADGKINDTYQIIDDGNEIYVYYYKVGSDNSPQAYASIYDKSTDSWQLDVRLTSAKNKVTSPSIAILPGGDILTVYNSLDRETQLVSLEWDIKHIRKDFEIAYVLYDLDAKSGEKINLNIGIKNIGDYVIRSVDVFAFGQMNTIVFDNAVEIGEFATIKVEREFSISADGQEIITVRFDDIVRQYMLTTRFTDVSIDGVRRIDKEREYYDLILKNSSEEASKVYLDIYYNGELIDTTEMFLSGNETLTYTYFNDEFVNGGYVYFEIRTEMADKYESDNSISFCVEYMVEKEPVKINPYYQSMQIAKYL